MKKNESKLYDALNSISVAINNDSRLNWINAGGCGLFAAIVTKQFKLPEDALKLFYDCGDMYDIAHIVIKVDENVYYDSNGFNNHSMFLRYESTPVTYSYLTEVLSMDIWNNMFDRKKLTPIITEIVKTEAKKYYETI